MSRVTLFILFALVLPHVGYPDSIRVELAKTVGTETVIFEQVKPIFDANCVDCHGSTAPKAGLNLAVFPFTSTRIAELPLIIDKVLGRVNDAGRPMPPKTRTALTSDQVALIQAWKDGGLQTQVKQVYVTSIKVLGDDGTVKQESIEESDVNPFDTGVVYELSLPSAEPSISSSSPKVVE